MTCAPSRTRSGAAKCTCKENEANHALLRTSLSSRRRPLTFDSKTMPHPPPKKYSKRRLAEIQIFRAIKVLEEENDPVSTLTLAGAAEEILGNMLRARGQKPAFDSVVEWNEEMWSFAAAKAKEQGYFLNVPDLKEIKRRVNRTRNELKHICEGKPVAAYYRWNAEEMLRRAIVNYYCLYGRHPPQKTIVRWFEGG